MKARCYDYKPSFNVMKVVKAQTYNFDNVGCHWSFGRIQNNNLCTAEIDFKTIFEIIS